MANLKQTRGKNVFFPMHFLGNHSMPRRIPRRIPHRIPDYLYAFARFNAINSFSSIISIVSTCLFGYAIYDQLDNRENKKNLNYCICVTTGCYFPCSPRCPAKRLVLCK